MFPQIKPRDHTEVVAFMAALGSTKPTIFEDLSTTPAQVARIHFSTSQFNREVERPLAVWQERVDYTYRPSASSTSLRWLHDLNRHLKPTTIAGTEMYPWHLVFDALDRIADLLVPAGYARSEVADTVTLYIACATVWDLGDDATPEELYRCAALNRVAVLTPEQKLDAASRLIPVDELVALLAQGLPYTLIKDMFPLDTD